MPRGGKKEGAGRCLKYGYDLIPLTVSLPREVYEAIAEDAEKCGVFKNHIVIGNLAKIMLEINT